MTLQPEDLLWIRILDNLISGCVFAAIGATCVSFLREKQIGHRALINYAVIFCAARAFTSFCVSWSLWAHHDFIMMWVRSVTVAYSAFFGLAVVAAKRDLLITLCVTEAKDQERHELSRDVEQLRLNLKHMNAQAMVASKSLVQEQQSITRERRSDEHSWMGGHG